MNKLEDFFAPIEGKSWRELANTLIYVRCPQKMGELKEKGFELDKDDDGFLCIGYIDYKKGLCFCVTAGAKVIDEKIIYSKINDKAFCSYSYDELKAYNFLSQDYIQVDLETFYPDVLYIIENFEKPLGDILDIREMNELDGLRDSLHPDKVRVLLIGKNKKTAAVWVLCNGFGENCLKGKIERFEVGETEGQEVFGNFVVGNEIDFILIQKQTGEGETKNFIGVHICR